MKKHSRSQEFLDVYNNNPCSVRIIKDNLTDEEACQLEMERIALHRKESDCVLTNKTKGGEPRHTFIASPEYRKAMSERTRGELNGNYAHHWSEGKRREASERLKNLGHSAGIKNPRCRPVMCVETGKVYPYMRLACKEINVKDVGSIHVALKHPHRTAGGFHWVDSTIFPTLDTLEARREYLENLPFNPKHRSNVPLDSDV